MITPSIPQLGYYREDIRDYMAHLHCCYVYVGAYHLAACAAADYGVPVTTELLDCAAHLMQQPALDEVMDYR